jgi:serine/threonine-protein kinase
VQDPLVSTSEKELRAHIERVLSSHYQLDREIGRGGMGIVYRGHDRRLKRPIAIKVLPPELGFRSEIRTRFLKEAETAAQLSHPNIVPIFSVHEQENLVFFVMACVDGQNIAQVLHGRGPFDPVATRHILRQVAEALDYAHVHGVVHRDIKPDNIIIENSTGQPMVTDFGIARAVTDTDSRLTATGIAIGTPAFMSPEQSVGDKEIDGRSDLYSLGVVGYQMLCGQLPFTASNTPAMLMKHIAEIPERIDLRRPEVPGDLARAVMLLLEKDPANRFQSAAALAAALESGDVPAYRTPAKVASRASAPNSVAGTDTEETGEDSYEPTLEELRRWNTPKVARFRRALAYFIPINLVLLLFGLFTGKNLLSLSLIWSVYIAYQYAGLWSRGFDWRDVFRQPRHRTLLHVASLTLDQLEALSDSKRRRELRSKARKRRPSGLGEGLRGTDDGSAEKSGARRARSRESGPAAASYSTGAAAIVSRASDDRDEIRRQIGAMPKRERAGMQDVLDSADALLQRVSALARVPQIESDVESEALATIEREIRALEAEANPLDRDRSETRVRRLAFLRRQHRALAETRESGRNAANKLEECAAALRNMRLDVVRLRAGTQSVDQLTLLASRALSLADEVDGALLAAEEVAREHASRTGSQASRA